MGYGDGHRGASGSQPSMVIVSASLIFSIKKGASAKFRGGTREANLDLFSSVLRIFSQLPAGKSLCVWNARQLFLLGALGVDVKLPVPR